MSFFTKEKIIVPWDFSDMSKTALARAVELAESNEQVEVVHVTPYPAAMEPSVIIRLPMVLIRVCVPSIGSILSGHLSPISSSSFFQ